MSGIENNINNINPSDSIADKKLSAADALLVMDSRCEASNEKTREEFLYSKFCENLFKKPEKLRWEDEEKYNIRKSNIEKNEQDCINIFDQCLINS